MSREELSISQLISSAWFKKKKRKENTLSTLEWNPGSLYFHFEAQNITRRPADIIVHVENWKPFSDITEAFSAAPGFNSYNLTRFFGQVH